MDKKIKEEIVDRIEEIPTLPFVMQKLLEIVESQDFSVSEVADVITRDQAILSKVLQVVNSAFYGFQNRIGDARQAAVLLGANRVCEIALSVGVFALFHSRELLPVDVGSFWKHNLATAVGSVVVARRVGFVPARLAYVPGLFHDIGRAVLIFYATDCYRSVVHKLLDCGTPTVEAERELLGVDHCDVGGWIAERWNLPDYITDVVRYHCYPSRASHNVELVSIVRLAADIVCALGIKDEGIRSSALDLLSSSVLGVSKESLKGVAEEIEKEFLGTLSSFVESFG